MDALASYFDEVILCVPVVDDAKFRGVGLTAPNIDFAPLPHFDGRLSFLCAVPNIQRKILAVLNNAELGLAIIPSYVGATASIVCQRQDFPLFQWVVGDWSRNVQAQRSRPLGRWLASRLWSPLLDRVVMRLTQNVLTFYNARILYDQGKPYHLTRISSSIRKEDFYVRDDLSSPTPPYRLLFVGRLSREKGVPYLLEAVALLVAQGEAVELHLVGAGPLEDELRQRTQTLSITDHVQFHGFVPQGAALRRLYRESDIFILPSIQDQQPKVLMEAMSQSVPVIATQVGGIPSTIQDGETGLLVPPAQPEAIAEAVCRVTQDSELRHRLIKQGLAYTRAHTVEQETACMMRQVAAYFNQGGTGYETNT
jgi:glycosyltransferase involved in cell wall biosynthesis